MSEENGPAKFTIASVENPTVKVEAQFNPKELSIDKSVPWNKHKNPKGDIPMLEFTNAENRTMSFELFFDDAESGSSVTSGVQTLHQLTLIREDASKESERHPPRVIITWGGPTFFKGVIESFGTKYTMFSSNGTPIRATCTLKIKEVSEVQAGGE